MKRFSLSFTAPWQVSIIGEEPLPAPEPHQVLVQTSHSAISPGTELLIYRGEFPEDLTLDDTIEALSGGFRYPLKYGYSAAGRVIAVGSRVDPGWEGKKVFAFQPHTSHFLAETKTLIPLPENVSLEEAVFLPNAETAVNFLMDGAPMIGEQVAVLGQGIVGLLTTALLAQFPLASLVSLDRYPLRRRASLELGAHASLDPDSPQAVEAAHSWLKGERAYSGADLVYELTGSPAALDLAISLAGFEGRVVIGSWYGRKRAPLNLGGRFHRSRIQLVSSQVSTLASRHTGRWDKARRFQVAWQALEKVEPSRLITHRFPIEEAEKAYQLLDKNPGEAIQVIFTYPKE